MADTKTIAERRVNGATNALRLLGNLGAKSYGLTPEQIDAIEREVFGALEATMNRLRHAKAERQAFTLPS